MRIYSNSFAVTSYLPQQRENKNFDTKMEQDRFVSRTSEQVGFNGLRLPKFIKRMMISKSMKEDVGFHCYLADKMKQFFDFNCGYKNYTLISIGRSMASVTETLGKRGRDTVCIPLSGLSYGLPKEIKDVNIYRNFLQSKGLTKEIIEANPDRHYILIDNAITGNSLDYAKKFLSREDLLGNANRLEICSAQEIFGKKYQELALGPIFSNGIFQSYSPVGRLDLYNLKNVFVQGNYKTCQENFSKKALRNKELFDFEMQERTDKYYKKRNR